jgi:hypothetical protein
MREVVKKEVLKLLKARVIYPISDSEWVSPVQVVLKKGGMTVIRNEKNELIPQWTLTGWRMCIDYWKLNKATQKDHFPLPFIDEIPERLANHSFFFYPLLLLLHGWLLWLSSDPARAKPPSHVHMALSHTGECHLDCVMLQHHFKGAW